MNQNALSSISKRKTFHRQIRAKQRELYFQSLRKQLYLEQTQNTSYIQCFKGNEEILEQLRNGYAVDWEAINHFIISHRETGSLDDLLPALVQFICSGESLSNEHALAVFINIVSLCQGRNLPNQTVEILVDRLVPANTTSTQQATYRLGNRPTVEFLLYIVADFSQEKHLFEPLTKFYPLFEQQDGFLAPEYIYLMSALGTNPKLLPSQKAMLSILESPLSMFKDANVIFHVSNLVENYVRSEKQENLEVSLKCICFIEERLREIKFPRTLKNELVELLESILFSPSALLTERILELSCFRSMLQQLFYRSQNGANETLRSSLKCFSSLIDLIVDARAPIEDFMDESQVFQLLINSLLIEDQMLRNIVSQTILNVLANAKYEKFLLEDHRLINNLARYSLPRDSASFRLLQALERELGE